MATLTVTIKEEVVLDGHDHGSEVVKDIANVTEFFERSITCTQTEATIVSFGAAASGSTFIDTNLEYLRITNLDTTNFVALRVLGSSEEYFVKISAGDSFVLFNDEMDANATGSQSMSLANIDDIKAVVDTGAAPGTTVQISIFAAA